MSKDFERSEPLLRLFTSIEGPSEGISGRRQALMELLKAIKWLLVKLKALCQSLFFSQPLAKELSITSLGLRRCREMSFEAVGQLERAQVVMISFRSCVSTCFG